MLARFFADVKCDRAQAVKASLLSNSAMATSVHPLVRLINRSRLSSFMHRMWPCSSISTVLTGCGTRFVCHALCSMHELSSGCTIDAMLAARALRFQPTVCWLGLVQTMLLSSVCRCTRINQRRSSQPNALGSYIRIGWYRMVKGETALREFCSCCPSAVVVSLS